MTAFLVFTPPQYETESQWRAGYVNDAMLRCASDNGLWDGQSKLYRFPQSVRIVVPRPQAPPAEKASSVDDARRQFSASMTSVRLTPPMLAAAATGAPKAESLAAAQWTAALSASKPSAGTSYAGQLLGGAQTGKLNPCSAPRVFVGAREQLVSRPSSASRLGARSRRR